MPYEYLDHEAHADVAFEAWGESLEEMFIAAADALMNAMVADLETIERRYSKIIEVESEDLDMLLFNLLQEIIFFKDADSLLLRLDNAKVESGKVGFYAKATAHGDEIDSERHDFIVDVKAVTLHKFNLEKTPRGWKTFIILDV